MKTKIHNLKSKKEARKRLRNNMTKAEIVLWSRLKSRQFGYKFRRQHGIGSYIVDFYCPQLKLVVEIDGGIHYCEKNIQKDLLRQKYLEKEGLKIIRYANIEVLENLESVLSDLIKRCKEFGKAEPPLNPLLRKEGRGRLKR